MIDILITTFPFCRPEILGAPAQLKAYIQSKGFTCVTRDWNIDLYNKLPNKEQFFNRQSFVDKYEFSNNTDIENVINDWIKELKLLKPKWLGISIFSHLRSEILIEFVLEKIKKELPDLIIVIGGHAISIVNLGEELLEKKLINYFINGEGEIPIIKLLNGITKGPGINNKELERIKDLDSLPYADYSDYNFNLYKKVKIPIFLSRGCVNRCIFCVSIFKTYFCKSGKMLADEIFYYYNKYGISSFDFVDSLISGHSKKFKDFVYILSNYNIPKLRWSGMHYVWPESHIDKNTFKKIKETGCDCYSIGLESGSYKVRKDMGKDITDETIDYNVIQCYENKIEMVLLLIIGYPTETESDFQMTLNMLKKYRLYKTNIKVHLGITYYINPDALQKHKNKGHDIKFDEHNNWYYKDNNMLTRVERWFRLKKLCEELGYRINDPSNENVMIEHKKYMRDNMDINDLYKKGLLTKDQKAIYDYKFQTNMRDAPWKEWLDQPGYFECRDEYIKKINDWIHSTKKNSIVGLDKYPVRDMTIGTTQVFDEAYYMYANKRLRVFRGEYTYHKRVFKNVEFLDNKNGELMGINGSDWIIISLPFCGIGDKHPLMNEVLNQAYMLQIPVIIDCAWFGTCRDIDFDFNHPGITHVCFSLTKGLGLGHLRSGIRYSKEDNDSIIRQQNNYNHLVLVTAQIGIYQMEKFTPDFITDKYYKSYLEVCNKLKLIPTKCAHIALAPEVDPWDDFIIDGLYRKVGLRQLVKDYL